MSKQLTAAERVAIARNPQRPNITDYIGALFTDFFECKGDRLCGEDAGILGGVAELFDLPVDVVAGLPRLELIGNRQLYLERHTGLLAYSDTQIDANTGFGVLRIRGERLTLVAMTGEELRIGGKIDGVEWVSC